MESIRIMKMRPVLAVVVGLVVTARAVGLAGLRDEQRGEADPIESRELLAQRLGSAFHPPAGFANDLGGYRSPLRFRDGRTVRTADDWNQRRREIQQTWHELMGPWPPLLDKPRIEYLEQERRDDIIQHHIRLEIAPGRTTEDAYLLLPRGDGPFPAALVVFYDAKTGIGRGTIGPTGLRSPAGAAGLRHLVAGSRSGRVLSRQGKTPAPATFVPRVRRRKRLQCTGEPASGGFSPHRRTRAFVWRQVGDVRLMPI